MTGATTYKVEIEQHDGYATAKLLRRPKPGSHFRNVMATRGKDPIAALVTLGKELDEYGDWIQKFEAELLAIEQD